jgi:hypothetical protein
MNIVITYDPTLTDQTNAIQQGFTSAVTAAVQYFNTTFSNNIAVNITFGYGILNGTPMDGSALAESEALSDRLTYQQLYNALAATDTTSAVQRTAVASLAATDPSHGDGVFKIHTAEEKALGLFTGTPTAVDGWVGLGNGATWSWSQNSVAAGAQDAVSAIEHEISEVLGRVAAGGAADSSGTGRDYTALDLFRYTAASNAAAAAPGTAVGSIDQPFAANYHSTTQSYFSYDGQTVTLPFSSADEILFGNDIGDWNESVHNDSFGYGYNGESAPLSATDVQVMNVLRFDLACFLPDTRIATPSGSVAVQDLKIGDLVTTLRGEALPVVWIGTGQALATRGRRSAASPVIVRKGALGPNVPALDLRISKGHALFIDDVLIPVEFLINHRSILWDDRAQEVTVYHIELERHDVLLANGAPAESYRDDGNRWLFRNGNTGWGQPTKPPCAPVLTGGPIVDELWSRLLTLAGPRPGLPLTDAPDLHLVVDGIRIDGVPLAGGGLTFRLPAQAGNVRIVSRAGAPEELGLARDPRVLGVAIRQIVTWRRRFPTIVEAENALLSDGFHPYEPDNGFRWTNGDASLPLKLWAGADAIDLYVAGQTRYPLLAAA